MIEMINQVPVVGGFLRSGTPSLTMAASVNPLCAAHTSGGHAMDTDVANTVP